MLKGYEHRKAAELLRAHLLYVFEPPSPSVLSAPSAPSVLSRRVSLATCIRMWKRDGSSADDACSRAPCRTARVGATGRRGGRPSPPARPTSRWVVNVELHYTLSPTAAPAAASHSAELSHHIHAAPCHGSHQIAR